MNNPLAIHNSRLVRTYLNIDTRAKTLAMMSSTGQAAPSQPTIPWHMSSTRGPSCHQLLAATRSTDTNHAAKLRKENTRGHNPNCEWLRLLFLYRDEGPQRLWGEECGNGGRELLLAFFDAYANHFDYARSVVSVRTGLHLTKEEKGWVKSVRSEYNHWFAIEDPFDTSHDLGRVADKKTRHAMRWELRRAYQILSSTAELFSLVAEYEETIEE